MKNNIRKKLKKCDHKPQEDLIESLTKKVKLLESQFKESEEKRKKSILDQHEAEYATRKIKSEHERLKIENSCLNNLLDLQKGKNQATNTTQTKPFTPDLKRKQQQIPKQSQDPQMEQQKVPQVHVQVPQVQDPNVQLQEPKDQLEEPQVQLHKPQVQPQESQVQFKEPQVQLHKPQLQEPREQLQDPRVQSHQSILKSYRSYKEALASQKSGELIFSCGECSYPFRSKEEMEIHTVRHTQLHCTKCNNDFNSKLDLKFHINYENKCERQWNCKECGYQGNSPILLKTHINETHTEPLEVSFPCTFCSDFLKTKWYFMIHIRDNHVEQKEACKHFQNGKCKFSEDDCWGKHVTSTSNDKFECHSCKDIFSTKNLMIKHRKTSHRTKQCNEFAKGTCKHGDEHCWYMHKHQDFHQANMFKRPPLSPKINQ